MIRSVFLALSLFFISISLYAQQSKGDTYFQEGKNWLHKGNNEKAIKAFQSRGKGVVGERDIHRTPFEACAIPLFDAANPDHIELARLSQHSHMIIAKTTLTGAVVRARRDARAALAREINAINVISRRLLGVDS